jgi:SAM-dependent methyltransferase
MRISEKLEKVKVNIDQNSPFDSKETKRITDKWFQKVPRAVEICLQGYGFDRKKVLDIGCAYGQSLLFWGIESEGIDVQPNAIELCTAMGRKIYNINVENGFLPHMRDAYEAVYSSNLIEHLVAPHLYLVRLHSILREGGLLAIAHPVVPAFPIRKIWEMLGFKGWKAVEHVNFFTPETIKLTLSFSGFEVIKQYNLGLPNLFFLRQLFRPISIQCLSICRKVDHFKYNWRRDRFYDPDWGSDLDYFHIKEQTPSVIDDD